MRPILLSNLIENPEKMNKLSRESLLKLINLTPSYFNKNFIELIDEEIKKLNEATLIEISNLRLVDIRDEICKTRYSAVKNYIDFSTYEYESHLDIFFSGREENIEKLIEKMALHIIFKNYKSVQLTSKSSKVIRIFVIDENFELINLKTFLREFIVKSKNQTYVKIRLFLGSASIFIEPTKYK